MAEPEPIDPNDAAKQLGDELARKPVRRRDRKVEKPEQPQLSPYDLAWRRAFFWTLLLFPFLTIVFWFFLVAGFFQLTDKQESGHMEGRGFIRGSILGAAAAIPLWFAVCASYFAVDSWFASRALERASRERAERVASYAEEEAKLDAQHRRRMEEAAAKLAVEKEAERIRYEASHREESARYADLVAKAKAEEEARRARMPRPIPTTDGQFPASPPAQEPVAPPANAPIGQAEAEPFSRHTWKDQQAEARAARENARMQAEIEKNRAELQAAEAQLRDSSARLAKLKGEVTAWTNRHDVAAKLSSKAYAEGATNAEKFANDARNAATQLEEAKRALWQHEEQVAAAQRQKDTALQRLRELGVEPVASFPDPEVQPGEVPRASHTIKLKDGAAVEAVKVVDGGDVYSVKTTAGKFVTLKKADVAEIPEELLPKK